MRNERQAVSEKLFNMIEAEEEDEGEGEIEDDGFLQVEKLGLYLPEEGEGVEREYLTRAEKMVVWKNLKEVEGYERTQAAIEVTKNNGMVNAEKIKKLREAIHRDYDGTVMREGIWPDPPVRGLYGEAYIPLIEGAVPQRQKPFIMHGEKLEAYKKVVEDWIEKKYIERPTKKGCEWVSAGMVVPKKSATFPWRGWWTTEE